MHEVCADARSAESMARRTFHREKLLNKKLFHTNAALQHFQFVFQLAIHNLQIPIVLVVAFEDFVPLCLVLLVHSKHLTQLLLSEHEVVSSMLSYLQLRSFEVLFLSIEPQLLIHIPWQDQGDSIFKRFSILHNRHDHISTNENKFEANNRETHLLKGVLVKS